MEEEIKEKTLSALLNEGGNSVYLAQTSKRSNNDLDDGSFEHVNYPLDYGDSANTNEADLSVSLHADPSTDPLAGILGTKAGRGARAASVSKAQPDVVMLQQLSSEASRRQFLRGILRVRRLNTEEQESYDWQGASIAVPKSAQPIQTLAQLEEVSHFLSKSCRSGGADCSQQWTPDDLFLLKVCLPSSPLLFIFM